MQNESDKLEIKQEYDDEEIHQLKTEALDDCPDFIFVDPDDAPLKSEFEIKVEPNESNDGFEIKSEYANDMSDGRIDSPDAKTKENLVGISEDGKLNIKTETYEDHLLKWESLDEKTIEDCPEEANKEEEYEKPYKCEICDKRFREKRYLMSHSRTHSGEKPFKCEVCNKYFGRKGCLNKHSKIHKGEKLFKCEICNKSFLQKDYLTIHSRTHTGEKPFKCDLCHKSFLIKQYLTTHLRSHTGEKPFQCDVCHKSFLTRQYLTIHSRIHTGEKPFKCKVCNKCYSQSGSLIEHSRTHTGEKPYKCKICGKAFPRKQTLTTHLTIHTKKKLRKVVSTFDLIADEQVKEEVLNN